jgi:hypothetical protein
MVARYPKIITYFRALPILYTPKRRAEVAPGVGKDADWILITRDGWQFIHPSLIAELGIAYEELQEMTQAKLTEVESRLEMVINKAAEKEKQLQVPPIPTPVNEETKDDKAADQNHNN